jgi:REP element-mobilizing transposase RayT
MPVYGRHCEPGHLQSITISTYRRATRFELDLFRWYFVQVRRGLRSETGFLLVGWVRMPKHLHLLIRPEAAASRFMQ